MKTLATALLALVLHLLLGWMWTVLAGAAGGYLSVRRGWLVGAAGVAAGWGALVAYNLLFFQDETRRMAETVGGILGNLPGFAVVVASLLTGAVLGALGGFVGAQAARLFRPMRRSAKKATS